MEKTVLYYKLSAELHYGLNRLNICMLHEVQNLITN
jgi:hypothetical protein